MFRQYPWLLGLAVTLLTPVVGINAHEASDGVEGHGDAPVHEGESIGAVDFRVACDESVRADFDRALGLMHHMMYEQSRASFEAIAEADPDCAMAYWGVATTLFQPLWPERPDAEARERGWRNIEKAAELAETERERALITATAGFFREPQEADYWTRIDRWVEGMDAAYEAHRDDLDVAALYALSRLTLAQRVEDRDPLQDEAETVLRDVHSQEPEHPGAVHYTIHATDVDGRGENALDVVQTYGDIAPEVPHALHMPSHIYVRLGDWPRVIEWNRRSSDAALGHRVNGGISFHYVHAIDYLVYAHLQRGEDDKALAAYEEAAGRDRHQVAFGSAFHLAAMPARIAVEQRDWERAAGLEPRTPEYLPWDDATWAEGLTWLARGLGGVHIGDLERAREAEQALEALRERAEAAGEDDFATYIEVDRRILSGWIAQATDDPERAVALIRAAAELEDTVEKHPITPGALLPPYEALGELLMALERPAEALEAYEASDAVWPGRYNTLAGAARAAEAAGDDETARTYAERLQAVVAEDAQRGPLVEAGAISGE